MQALCWIMYILNTKKYVFEGKYEWRQIQSYDRILEGNLKISSWTITK